MTVMSQDRLAEAFRRWGYLHAELDPLGRLIPFPHPDLEESRDADANRWRSVYCGSIGAQFMHMPYPDRCRFIAERMEAEPQAPDRRRILRRIAEIELFERFLHGRYVGTKRYSLEGGATLVTALDAILDGGAEMGAELALIGMSHRGRLSIMTRVVGVQPALIFAGFGDIDPRSTLGGGDVKYHLGATGAYQAAGGRTVAIHLVSNPSHLETVDPVLMGRTRARQRRLEDSSGTRVLPIAVHGDAAFAGQGIVSETLNLAGLPGFSVAGTVHVIVNNLIGFTAEPVRLHSSRYASDAALRLPIPILHVNGEDPEAVARASRIAVEYRHAFASDVVIDLIGFRRYGHSEVEDPTTTQPLLYVRIAERPMLFESYGARAVEGPEAIVALRDSIVAGLEEELAIGRAMTAKPVLRRLPSYWDRYTGGPWRDDLDVETGVRADRLEAIAREITRHPEGFAMHPKVAKGLERRLAMVLGEAPIDWSTAEALAFGSLLLQGTPVRLAGQDSRRGTFNQRHAVWIDRETGREHIPLQQLAQSPAFFEILDTPLSEAASLGFEYGFSRDYPEALVCWEAQFGDFANGAQVIVDQFVVAAEDKWGLLSGLVLLLPHGFEGQGPEHSSARLERYLQLAAEDLGPVFPSPAPAGAGLVAKAPDHPHAQGDAPAPGGRLRPARADARAIPERSPGFRRRGRAPRARLLGPNRSRSASRAHEAGGQGRRDRRARADLPVSRQGARRGARRTVRSAGDRLGAGGAGQHGSALVRPASLAAARGRPARDNGPSIGEREPRHGLDEGACHRAAASDGSRVGPIRLRLLPLSSPSRSCT